MAARQEPVHPAEAPSRNKNSSLASLAPQFSLALTRFFLTRCGYALTRKYDVYVYASQRVFSSISVQIVGGGDKSVRTGDSSENVRHIHDYKNSACGLQSFW